MSFLSSCITTLVFILLDIILTSIRPTWIEGGDVAHYILLGVHILVVILEGIMVFVLFSATIWFAAGLLGQLGFSVLPTLPCWVLRFIVCFLPWVYKRFIADDSVTPWSHGVYGFLTILDILSCIALGISLCYTMCCLTDKHMYIPYHTAINQQEREAAEAINTHGVAAGDVNYHNNINNVTAYYGNETTTVGDGHSHPRQVRFNDPYTLQTPSQPPLVMNNFSIATPGNAVRNDSFSFTAPHASGAAVPLNLPPIRGRSRAESEVGTPRHGSVSARSFAN